MTTPAPAIVTGGLTKHYPGVQALTDLTLEVPAGSIYGFLGPNGAGKTTALKLLAGLTRPTRGGASVAGVPVEAGAAYRRQIGFLGQEPRFYGWMSGRETIEYVGSLYPPAARPSRQRVQEVIDLVGIADAADRPTKTYSGGMRQRLGIAQALVARPAVLLLDEPVSALDPLGRKEVLELMRAIKGDVTVFYSTHILDDVSASATTSPSSTTADSSARSRLPSSCRASPRIGCVWSSALRPTTPRWPWPPFPACSPWSPRPVTATRVATCCASIPSRARASSGA